MFYKKIKGVSVKCILKIMLWIVVYFKDNMSLYI